MLKQSEQMSLIRRGKLQSGMASGDESGSPGPLEVEPTDAPVAIQHFSDEIEPWHFF
jgi:hypothetical protein